jgi:glycosyltransferase involved in cell wall biosynthesis
VTTAAGVPGHASELTVVLPVFNEAPALASLWDELAAVLDAHWTRAEVIFVDDASTDGGFSWLRALAAADGRVRVLRFARHAGLTAALEAGCRRARSPIVVTMDSDLQNDPADIPRLVAALAAADVATGIRVRRDDPWLKRVSSRIANAVRNAVTGETVRDSACTLRAMRRECAAALPSFNGMHRFLPTLMRLSGFRVVEVPVGHRARRFGSSKFGVRNRAGRAFVDLLVVRWMQGSVLRYSIDPNEGRDGSPQG